MTKTGICPPQEELWASLQATRSITLTGSSSGIPWRKRPSYRKRPSHRKRPSNRKRPSFRIWPIVRKCPSFRKRPLLMASTRQQVQPPLVTASPLKGGKRES